MSTLLVTPTGAHLAHLAPSLFGGAPRFVAHRRSGRGRLFGNGARFSDEGDIDFLRVATLDASALLPLKEPPEGVLAEIVARHLVAKAKRGPSAFAKRPDNGELARRFATHLATSDDGQHAVDDVVAPAAFFQGEFGRLTSDALGVSAESQRELGEAILAFAPASVVVSGPYRAEVVRKDGVRDHGAPSQAAAFAAGLAPFILRQMATFADVPEAIEDGFDDVSLAIALARTEERVLRALLTKSPCFLGGDRAPLFVAPDPAHFALPASLQGALDSAERDGVALSDNLTALLAARKREQARVRLAAQTLAAFEAELRLPPLDDAAEWFAKSGLFQALANAQDVMQQEGEQGDALLVTGRDRALFDRAGDAGIRLRPLSAKWLRPLLRDVPTVVAPAPAPAVVVQPREVVPPEVAAPQISPAVVVQPREDAAPPPAVVVQPPEVAAPPPAVVVQPPEVAAPPPAVVVQPREVAPPPPAVAVPAPEVVPRKDAAPPPAVLVQPREVASPPAVVVPSPEVAPREVAPPPAVVVQPGEVAPPLLPASSLRALPVDEIAEDVEDDGAPPPPSWPLFVDAQRAPVSPGFDFDSFAIVVDGVSIPNARERVGRLHQGLAASLPEARAGSLVWIEGDRSLGVTPFED